MAGGWDSALSMRRVARGAATTAVIGLAFGLVALLLALPLAVPAFVIGTAAVVIALFAAFRASHLQDIDRQPRPNRR